MYHSVFKLSYVTVYLSREERISLALSHLCLTILPSAPLFLGHFLLLLEQVHTSQIQQHLCVPSLGILHWLVPGSLLHGLRPTLHHHYAPEDPGYLQEGRGLREVTHSRGH